MGALATLQQRAEFEANLATLAAVADIAIGGPESAASKALPASRRVRRTDRAASLGMPTAGPCTRSRRSAR